MLRACGRVSFRAGDPGTALYRGGTRRRLALGYLSPAVRTKHAPKHASDVAAFALLLARARLRLRRGRALAAERPHILYITADDLGWKDVGYHGSSIRTPTLDRLAKEGARLEDFYVQPYSTQTRAAVLTGRYPMRYGLQTMQVQWFSEFGLPADERTLAQALKEAGYRTALIGKWQLGHAQKELLPTQRGYDSFYGHLTGEIDYFKKTDRGGRPDWWRNDKRLKEEGYATTLMAKEAVASDRAPRPGHPPVPASVVRSAANPLSGNQALHRLLPRR